MLPQLEHVQELLPLPFFSAVGADSEELGLTKLQALHLKEDVAFSCPQVGHIHDVLVTMSALSEALGLN